MAVPTVDLGGDPARRRPRRSTTPVATSASSRSSGTASTLTSEHAAWDVAHEFFALPLDDKLAVAIPTGDAYGYGPFKIERLAASLGATTPPDLKETFSVGPFEPPPPGLSRSGGGLRLLARTGGRQRLPTMEPAFRAYYESMAGLVARVMSAMAVGLGLDAALVRSVHRPPHVGTAGAALSRPRRAASSNRASCGPVPTPTTAR